MPKITACITTYNRSDRLRGAVESVLDQTYRDLVVRVFDNASEDGTPDLMARLTDPRVSYVRRAENIGARANMNAALADVETEYVVLLHDDDRLTPTFLEQALETLDSHPSAALAFAPWWHVDWDGRSWVPDRTGWREQRVMTGTELIDWHMRSLPEVAHVSASVFRTAALPRPAFDSADGHSDDVGLLLRLGLGHDAVFIPEPGTIVVTSPDSLSASMGQDLDADRALRDLKFRFLDGPARDREERTSWLAAANRLYLRRMMWHAGVALRRDHSPRAALELVRAARQVDPSVLTDRAAWRLGLAGAASPALARRIHIYRHGVHQRQAIVGGAGSGG